MVTIELNCHINTPAEFDEVRKLWEEIRSHYMIHRPKKDYFVRIYDAQDNAQGGGYIASAVRVDRKDWRVQFSRDNVNYHERDGESDP